MKKHVQIFLFFLFLSSGQKAKASLVSSFDVNLGFTSVSLKTNASTTNLSSPSALELNYVLKHASLSTAYVLSFYEMLEGQGFKLPYTQFSVGVRYYPRGFNGTRLIVDQNVSAQVWKATPFVGVNLGIANISQKSYNASVVEMSPRFGMEVPLTATLLGQAQLILHGGTSTGSNATQINYDGISGLLGLVFVGF